MARVGVLGSPTAEGEGTRRVALHKCLKAVAPYKYASAYYNQKLHEEDMLERTCALLLQTFTLSHVRTYIRRVTRWLMQCILRAVY